MTSGKPARPQERTIPKVVAWGAVAALMAGAWRYTDVFGQRGTSGEDPTPTTREFSYCEQRSALGEEGFLEQLTAFRQDQQAKGRLSANDENAGVTLLLEVQHSFKVNCPEFTLDTPP